MKERKRVTAKSGRERERDRRLTSRDKILNAHLMKR